MRLRRWLRRQVITVFLGLVGLPIGIWARFQRATPRQVQRILVIRLDLLGDVALSLPAVRSLRAGYPDARIDLLVRPAAVAIAAACPAVDRVLTYDVDAMRPSGRLFDRQTWSDLVRLVDALRAGRPDLAVGLFGHWASFFALSSGAPWRVGYRGEGFPGSYTDPVPGTRYRPAAAEMRYCLKLAAAAGGKPVSGTSLIADPAAIAAARIRFVTGGLRGPVVVCNAGSAAGDAKRWTPAGWIGLIDRIQRRGYGVVLVGTAAERPIADIIASGCAVTPLNVAGETTVAELLGVLAVADLVISGDSGPLHLADALGLPVLAIHGPSDPRISGPSGRRSAVVRLDLPCSPCYDATYAAECPLGHHNCMRQLTADRVEDAALPLLPVS